MQAGHKLYAWIMALTGLCLPVGLEAAADRILLPLDPARRVSLPGNVHPLAQARFDRGPADRAMPIGYATLLLAPAPGLEDFLTRLQQPGPGFRRWLTPGAVRPAFRAEPERSGQVAGVARIGRFASGRRGARRRLDRVHGTAGAAGRAFGTEIHRYLVNGEAHYANSTAPSIPAAFAAVVTAVRGLNDFRPRAQVRMAAPDYTSGGAHYLAPRGFRHHLQPHPALRRRLDRRRTKHRRRGPERHRIARHRQLSGGLRSASQCSQVVLVGSDPGVNSDQLEADLDIEWSGAVARQASIVYVYASDVFVAAQYAVDRNLAPVLSLSYSACEYYETAAWRAVAQQAAAEGISWIAASGDAGAAECDARARPSCRRPRGQPAASRPPFRRSPRWEEPNWTTPEARTGRDRTRPTAARRCPISRRLRGTIRRRGTAFPPPAARPALITPSPPGRPEPGVPDDGARDVPDVALAASPVRYPYFIVSSGAT